MAGGKYLKGVTITLVGKIKSDDDKHKTLQFSNDKIKQWVTIAGGFIQDKTTDSTNYCVTDKPNWDARSAEVQKALDLRAGGQDIQIVSHAWLVNVLESKTKLSTNSTLCRKVWPPEDLKGGEASSGRQGGQSNSTVELFQSTTADTLDDRARREIEARKKADKVYEDNMKKAQQSNIKARKQQQDAKMGLQAKVFEKGAKKARNDTFSENYHIYRDSQGFCYDILLTKVEVRSNKNERWALTLYEHNQKPANYAVNAQFAGTGQMEANTIVAGIGTSFYTAFHMFRTEFKKRTGVSWDRRISFAIERQNREKRDRGVGTGSPTGTQKGRPVSSQGSGSKGKVRAGETPFSSTKFQYHPPAYGSKGVITADEEKRINFLTGLGKSSEKPQRTDYMMSGGNGAGREEEVTEYSSPPQNSPRGSHGPAAEVIEGHGDTAAPHEFDTAMADETFQDFISQHAGSDTFGQTVDEFYGTEDPYSENYGLSAAETAGEGTGGLQEPLSAHEDTGERPYFVDTADAINDASIQEFLDSWPEAALEPGSQDVGETQLASRAEGEFLEHMNRPTDAAALQNVDESMEGYEQPQDDASAVDSASLPPALDLGNSLLGKRKRSTENEESPAVDTPIAPEFNEIEEMQTGVPLADEQNTTADEQLKKEFEVAEDEAMEV